MSSNRRTLLGALALSPATLPMALTVQAEQTNLIAADICTLQPRLTEGPYYIDPYLLREDITEGRPGRAVNLALQVVDSLCRPVEGLRVDIWHCDAQGRYSGFEREGTAGETFLRGTQPTDAQGVARFLTIFPGWYPGRAPHVHFKVFPDERRELTSQIFFDDARASAIYEGDPAYARSGERSTFNRNDALAQKAGPAARARLREVDGILQSALVVGIGEPDAA